LDVIFPIDGLGNTLVDRGMSNQWDRVGKRRQRTRTGQRNGNAVNKESLLTD